MQSHLSDLWFHIISLVLSDYSTYCLLHVKRVEGTFVPQTSDQLVGLLDPVWFLNPLQNYVSRPKMSLPYSVIRFTCGLKGNLKADILMLQIHPCSPNTIPIRTLPPCKRKKWMGWWNKSFLSIHRSLIPHPVKKTKHCHVLTTLTVPDPQSTSGNG